MIWVPITIISYFLFALVAITDKILLKGFIPSPKIYAFYIGFFGIFIFLLAPFGFYVPDGRQIIFSLLAGFFQIAAIVVLYMGLKSFDASRIVPAIGGLSPVFTFLLTYFFLSTRESLSISEAAAFALLVLGSFLISWDKSQNITIKSLKIAAFASFLFALYFVLAKLVYLSQTFINGLIWMRIGAFVISLALLCSKEVKEEIFLKRKTFNFQTFGILSFNGLAGAGAGILQNLAIALAGVAYVSGISALSGTQYLFLLILSLFLSFKFPQILKEKSSKAVIRQKAFAIALISLGLVLLAF